MRAYDRRETRVSSMSPHFAKVRISGRGSETPAEGAAFVGKPAWACSQGVTGLRSRLQPVGSFWALHPRNSAPEFLGDNPAIPIPRAPGKAIEPSNFALRMRSNPSN